jgi:hypothetical protein
MPVLDVTLRETMPLPNWCQGASGDPTLRADPCRPTVRLRRDLPATAAGRHWRVEVEVSIRIQDPEEALAECHGFLVDAVDGRAIGVVDDVEAAGPAGSVSALVVGSGWFGRRRMRIAADHIEVVIPAEARLIVREPPPGFTELDRRRG